MAGRIRDEDIALVRERSPIEDVIGERVALRSAGGGNLKGLCPFHDEKSPSFNVTPARGFFHCLAGETRVLTWDGPREIRELAGGTHRILSRSGDWVEARSARTGCSGCCGSTVGRNGRTQGAVRHRRAPLVRPQTAGDGTGHREVLHQGDLRAAATGSQATFPRVADPADDAVAVRRSRHGFTFGDGTPQRLRDARGTAPGHVDRATLHPAGIGSTGHRQHRRFPAVARLPIHRHDDLPRLPLPAGGRSLDRCAAVEESTDRVEEVFCAEVEQGHAFVLEDNILTGNCFGCGVGGDVISFVQKTDGLSFAEAVERLADRAGVQLRYEQGGAGAEPPAGPAHPAGRGQPAGRRVLRRPAAHAGGAGRPGLPRRARLRRGGRRGRTAAATPRPAGTR